MVNSSPFLARHLATCGSNGHLTSIQALAKFTRVVNTPMSIELHCLFSKQTHLSCPGQFLSILGSSGLDLDGSLSDGFFFLVLFAHSASNHSVFACFLVFLWIVSSSFAHPRVQTRARRSTVMRRPYPSVCRLQTVSVVAVLCCWHGIFLLSIL
jgi:hypothetical protein